MTIKNQTPCTPLSRLVRQTALGLAAGALGLGGGTAALAGTMADYTSIPPLVSTAASADMPNVLVILDNSNSMDEAPSGQAVGSANSGSKSEIARKAVKSIIGSFAGKIRLGLMAYQQEGVTLRQLHNSYYDASFDPANYDPAYSGGRDSTTKKYRVLKPGSTTEYIHYNVSLPFYSSVNEGTAYCWSDTANFDNGSETAASGPWDVYRCFGSKTGTSDTKPTWSSSSGMHPTETTVGFGSYRFSTSFFPTDSDLAQGILDFGTYLAWHHVGPTWFANDSPGKGYLHVPIADLSPSQVTKLNDKLATCQFVDAVDTPLRNAGLTPLEGTLDTALRYFDGLLTNSNEGGSSPAPKVPTNTCRTNNYVVLVTDGLPSTDINGDATADTNAAIDAVAAKAAALRAKGIPVYVVGFALPAGVSATVLDEVAAAGGTGTAFNAGDATSLNNSLQNIFVDVLRRTSSATAAGIVANSSSGIGAVYQALYDPKLEITNFTTGTTSTVTWTGTVQALFVDNYGYLREDGDQDGKLDGYDVDMVVALHFDELTQATQVIRYKSSSATAPVALEAQAPASLSTLKTLWNARDKLAKVSNVTTQRAYGATADTGRYIFSWIDDDDSGTVGTGEVFDFDSTNITAARAPYFDTGTVAEAQTLVEYVRGKEVAGFRNRSADMNRDGVDEVLRLGDIVHSSPLVVGTPSAGYEVHFKESTYQTFKNKYANRRQMIYVGANDGMLHAFNGGFWNETARSFDTRLPGDTTSTQHPLGTEIWAYAPYNLLPHLQWLKDPSYTHVYFVDGTAQVFDVPIFTPDATHPGGWGTILVVGMRLGGGPFELDVDGDGSLDRTLRSAYLVLDVTDPEQPPTLLAEITHADMGLTVSHPSLARVRTPNVSGSWATPKANQWYLVFGSGPNVLGTVTSTTTAKLFVYDLVKKEFVSGFDPLDLNESDSFVGDLATSDWNMDFIDDAVYFGTIGGSIANPTGKLKRLVLNTAAADPVDTSVAPGSLVSGSYVRDLLTPGQPFAGAPSFAVDNQGARWVYAGTGRMFTTNDNTSTRQQSFYGVKEPTGASAWGNVGVTALLNVSGISVYQEGGIKPTYLSGTATVNTFDKMLNDIQKNRSGWYRNLETSTTSAERAVTGSVVYRGALLFSSYLPSTNACTPEGSSRLFGLYYQTGTAVPGQYQFGILGLDRTSNDGDDNFRLKTYVDLGQGFAARPTVHVGDQMGRNRDNENDRDMVVFTQQSQGEIEGTGAKVPVLATSGGRRSWREIEL